MAALQTPQESHLLLQMVKPVAELSFTVAEDKERGRQWAWGQKSQVGWGKA